MKFDPVRAAAGDPIADHKGKPLHKNQKFIGMDGEYVVLTDGDRKYYFCNQDAFTMAPKTRTVWVQLISNKCATNINQFVLSEISADCAREKVKNTMFSFNGDPIPLEQRLYEDGWDFVREEK